MRRRIREALFGAVLAAFATAFVASGCNGTPDDDDSAIPPEKKPARNVILLIGDGMGPSQVTLGRLVGPGVHEGLALEKTPYVALVHTFPANALVTDSAAAATALSTGRKTTNGTIGQSPDGTDLETLGEWARKKGKSVGLVTTTTVTHATPASFAVHCPERVRETDIAELYLGAGVDVLLGGGLVHFPETLQQQFRDRGYTFLRTRKEMMEVKEKRLIGLFAEKHMDFELDRDPAVQPSLEEMLHKALLVLTEDPDGFFLMVEGGRIDHACHGHDASAAARDLVAFDTAVRAAVSFAEREGNTLVLVTADHATGGLAIGENVDVEKLRARKASGERMATLVNDGLKLDEVLRAWSGAEPTEELLKRIEKYRALGKDNYALQNAISHALSEDAGIAFFSLEMQATHRVTKGHDGTDVALYAWGQRAEDFVGVLDNTVVSTLIRRALEAPK